MKVGRFIRGLVASLAAVLIVAGVCAGSTWLYLHPRIERANGVVYGRREDRNLTLDVMRPANANGLGVVLMVSGGWKSAPPGAFPSWMLAPLLRRGYTVFAVCHISQPEATVMNIVQDVNRAVRFIRHNAREYGVDPQRLGVTGGSAGGHLSLMLATRGGPGPVDAADPVGGQAENGMTHPGKITAFTAGVARRFRSKRD